jgi:hypothetical protein
MIRKIFLLAGLAGLSAAQEKWAAKGKIEYASACPRDAAKDGNVTVTAEVEYPDGKREKVKGTGKAPGDFTVGGDGKKGTPKSYALLDVKNTDGTSVCSFNCCDQPKDATMIARCIDNTQRTKEFKPIAQAVTWKIDCKCETTKKKKGE